MCRSEFVPTLGGGRIVRTGTDLFHIFDLYSSLTGQMYDSHDAAILWFIDLNLHSNSYIFLKINFIINQWQCTYKVSTDLVLKGTYNGLPTLTVQFHNDSFQPCSSSNSWDIAISKLEKNVTDKETNFRGPSYCCTNKTPGWVGQ